ncbi:pimeloyl-ACP methyl ester carboxylesterase [Neorhizobium huautlense]|uniref:Pimeloyl-ACP methyl ester carboxylesterase n=1 Tax=Neorhizobium huautlense TaxID=67774 RepID=A0ABT9Q221_9HYPH|nr:alpha/beta hydrolase [Neorhizobium huautlense]MDP9840039.1 pimeloyl-ACP methyl ester carboxylesterase [Neorhizobium huautlense]
MTVSTYSLGHADQIISRGDTKIATRTCGASSDAPVLMLMGATLSMDGWPDELVTALAGRGLYVIRFDHRDTGQSSTVPFGQAEYTVEDMMDDTLAILDAYDLPKAHLVGMSLGGYIAQMIAVRLPERVATVTLISSEPLGWDGPPLPHISQEFLDHFSKLPTVDWDDPRAVTEFLMQSERLSAGSGGEFDENRAKAGVDRMLGRAQNISSMFNHGALSTTEDWAGQYRNVDQPTLVIHGEDDPILPIENGRALARSLPCARLLSMPGVGHELPARVLDFLTDEIAAHIGARHLHERDRLLFRRPRPTEPQ